MNKASNEFYELLLDQQSDLIRFEESTKKKVFKILEDMKKDISNQLLESNLNTGLITDFKKTRLTSYLKQINFLIDKNYKKIDQLTFDELFEEAKFTNKWTKKSIDGILQGNITNVIKIDRLKQIVENKTINGKTNGEWWFKQADNFKNSFNDQITMGLARNETIYELRRRIFGGTSQGEIIQGIFDGTKRQAEALVRTSVIEINNTILNNIYKENSDIIKGVEWTATLDSRTTVICISLDGLQWDLNYEPINHDIKFPGPTAHWNCRSTQIPVMKTYKEITNKDIKENIDRTRTSLDGIVEKKDYEEWLRGKPKEFQNEKLGVKKAELWRSGEIKNIRQLINQNGRELTIQELEKKYNI